MHWLKMGPESCYQIPLGNLIDSLAAVLLFLFIYLFICFHYCVLFNKVLITSPLLSSLMDCSALHGFC